MEEKVKTWLKNRASGIYYVQIPGEAPRWVSSGQKTVQDAVKWALRQAGDNPDGEALFGEFAKEFFIPGKCDYVATRELSGHKATEKHWRDTRAMLENYLLPRWGRVKLARIRASEFHTWLLGLHGVGRNREFTTGQPVPLSGKTKKQIRAIAVIIMDWAVFKREVLSNPLTSVPRITAAPVKRRAFRPAELSMMFPENLSTVWPDTIGIVSRLTSPWGVFMLIARETGMRPQEVCAMAWEDYRPARRAFIVSRAVDDKGRVKGLKTAANGVAMRAVGISERLAKILDQVKDGAGLIFSRPDGAPIRVDQAGKIFTAALDAIEAKSGGKLFTRDGRTLYSLRHTRNTEMLSQGARESVRANMGHLTDSMTDNYDDPDEEDLLRRIGR